MSKLLVVWAWLKANPKKTVAALGMLKYIVALNIEHHVFLTPWSQAYPDARVIWTHRDPGPVVTVGEEVSLEEDLVRPDVPRGRDVVANLVPAPREGRPPRPPR